VKDTIAVQLPNGQVQPEEREREVPVTMVVTVELKEVRELTVYTADGKEADKARVLKQLEDGGPVVVSADGQKVDPRYLRLFKDDVLVLVSPELAGTGQTSVRPAPLPAAGLRLVPGAVQVVPAMPAPAPAPAPKKM
jgi:hypothetical protein